MAKPKGSPKTGGRVAGVSNSITKDLKTMIQGALEAKGGQVWLEKMMDEQPQAMLSLIGKTLPKDINATVKGNVIIQATPLDEKL